MSNVTFDFSRTVGKIKPMHAMGQPPFAGKFRGFDFSYMEYLTRANVPYSRLHDVNGVFGGNRFVDIPNLFRDFDADENDPSSYDFIFTDLLIEAMLEHDLKPIFRLGVTIENQGTIKAYRIHPPKDFAKWARICEHVIRHYNEGWADGYTYGIEYWEIWNEPDNGYIPRDNQMWTGTPEQYYELYDVTAKHLKACFGDTIKVGGYASCGFGGIYYHPEKYGVDVPRREPDERYARDTFRIDFLYGFLDYIKAHGSPIDFFTWHSYPDVEKTLVCDAFLHRVLTEYGYGDLERHLNEWNNAHEARLHGTSRASAGVAAMMCAMQHSHTDMLCYYDSRLVSNLYCGLFAPLTNEPVCTYYSFLAFGQMYALGDEIACTCEGKSLYALGATNGVEKAVMIVNYTEEARTVTTNLDGEWNAYLVDREHYLEPITLDPRAIEMSPNTVLLLKA